MNRKGSKSALFLMELSLAILFFAAASAVCVQLFVKAHLMSQDTVDLNRAVAGAETAAAVLRAEDGDLNAALPLLEGAAAEDGGLVIYYDADWKPAAKEGAVYVMRLSPAADEVTAVTVERLEDGGELFSLPVRCHVPLTAD